LGAWVKGYKLQPPSSGGLGEEGLAFNTYKLELAAWGPRQEIKEVSVPAYLYEQLEEGEIVNIYLKAGLLEVPWFVVTEP
jgi:hypothetical protein